MKKRIITLENAKYELEIGGVIQRERLYWSTDKWKQFKLLKNVYIKLSNGETISILKGFEWDLASVPRIFWSIVPPDGDFELASLIHDYLYQMKPYSRKFADKEMYIWSKVINSTNKISIKNIDNHIRYFAVRVFGGPVWSKDK